MRKPLQLAAAFLIATAAIGAHAQITNPDALVAPPPRNPAGHSRAPHSRAAEPADNLQWLWPFTKPAPTGRADQLRFDVRFAALLDSNFKQAQAMWGSHVPLAEIIPRFLAQYGTVTTSANRYITVDGCVPSFCAAHGLLWADLGSPKPLLVFAAVNWSSEAHTTEEAAADYILWLFPNRELSADALPLALTEALAHWDARLSTAHRLVPHIANAILVEPDGTPHALNPALAGANTLPPQPDTVTPRETGGG